MTTNAEVADVLDAAYDVLLERGRCLTDLEGDDGSVCIIRACSLGAARVFGASRWFAGRDAYEQAKAVLRDVATPFLATWNEASTDDEVFDALRNAAKAEREKAGQP